MGGVVQRAIFSGDGACADSFGAPPAPFLTRARSGFVVLTAMVSAPSPTSLCAALFSLPLRPRRTLLKRMPADVNVALLRGGNSMGSRGIKEAIKNETVHVVSEKERERW